ncbi:MAG: folate family ECF transporter S component [Eubacteriales bacterium]|nr:folate family ECF transporter S component [Eubacteriales bacterium]
MKNCKTRRLAMDAMLVAMYVVLSMVSIKLPNMKITLDSLPILVAAALLGPIDGMAVGLLGSFINQMLTYGLTVTTPLWILPAGVRGVMVGLCAKRHGFDMGVKETETVTILSALVVTALNTGVMYVDSVIFGYYSWAYVFGAVIPRIIAGILTAAVFAAILPTLVRVLRERLRITNETEE